MSNLLTLLLCLPLIGGCLTVASSQRFSKAIALITSVVTFVTSLLLLKVFDPSALGIQLRESFDALGGMGLTYIVGVDGIAFSMVLLSTFLMMVSIFASLSRISERVKLYFASLLFMEFFILGAFLSLNVLLFYVFFESILIPMFLLIGIFGGERRIYAMYKFFIYTFFASMLMLVAFLMIGAKLGSFDYEVWRISVLSDHFSPLLMTSFWFALFISFAVKIPMVPVHTWLPDAHVEAPATASMILAGILLKLGGFAMIRFHLGCFQALSSEYMHIVWTLSIIALIYGSLLAWVQTDMKKIVAYSSIAHMAYVTMGIYSATSMGVSGAIMQMISHGVISAGLFFMVDVLYKRTHTRDIQHYSGLSKQLPLFSALSFILFMGLVGFPSTSGFVGELMVTLSVFELSIGWGSLIALGLILTPLYGLFLLKKVFWGEPNETVKELSSTAPSEAIVLVCFVTASLWIGLFPGKVTPYFKTTVHDILKIEPKKEVVYAV